MILGPFVTLMNCFEVFKSVLIEKKFDRYGFENMTVTKFKFQISIYTVLNASFHEDYEYIWVYRSISYRS